MAITITPMRDDQIESVVGLWQRAFSDRTHDFQINRSGFTKRVPEHPCCKPEGCLVALDGSRAVGFGLAAVPDEGTEGFLSVICVDPDCQHGGIGSRLLTALEAFVEACGKAVMRVGYRGNPMSFCVGVDVSTPAHRFLLNRGYRNRGSLSLIMEQRLEGFELREEIHAHIRGNEDRGVRFGLCDEDHREALCRFMEEHFPGGWEASVKRKLDGDAPYPVLVATAGEEVVGFTGPIVVNANGSAGFTGIGTRPDFRRRKIGLVLFHLLCAEFASRGGTYSTLHTGINNPAQEIYFHAGYRVRHLVDYGLEKRLVEA